MRSRFKALAVAAAALGIAMTGSFVAYAGWNTQSSGVSLEIRAVTMPRGVTPRVTAVHKKAVVIWRAQEVVSGVMATAYVVTAHNLSGREPQGVTRTLTATGGSTETVTFAASMLSGEKWTWTIVPRFGSWAGRRSAPTKPLTFPAASVPAIPDVIPRPSPSTAVQGSVEVIPEATAELTLSPQAQTVPSVPARSASASVEAVDPTEN